ncbi:MAG TPA: lactate 2-monooxygenase [Ohtaekwangia sp.]|uniref:lactate 2-monooxygenase n=1 Tax=Ohtaekwangia sp. TaxID=2066019 RepID=UPI002F944899
MKFSAPDWQKEIYLNGFAGILPQVNIDPALLEKNARRHMSRKAYAYIAGGAGHESTMLQNRQAFEKYSIVPRMLCDVSQRDTSITLFGQKIPSPFLLSPVGVLEMVHREADVAVARAAASIGIPYIFSNQASKPMESCAAVMNNSPRWFQLYWSRSNDLVASFVQRAERCGCSAIVVTLDTTMLGWRTRDLELAYLPFLQGKGIAQYTSDPVFQKMLDEPEDRVPVDRKITLQSIAGLFSMVKHYPGNNFIRKLKSGRAVRAVQKFTATYSNPATTWNDLAFLRQHTKLPILLKGILHPDDASKAIDYGLNGIIISNHGGRQVDGSIATLDALPAIANVVRKQIPIILDSGIRGGADAFKALALGATAIGIGRPYVYGLAIAGEQGVYTVLRNFMADFELTMALAGCKDISEITPERLQQNR